MTVARPKLDRQPTCSLLAVTVDLCFVTVDVQDEDERYEKEEAEDDDDEEVAEERPQGEL